MTNYTKAEQELINATAPYDGESWDTTDPFSNTFTGLPEDTEFDISDDDMPVIVHHEPVDMDCPCPTCTEFKAYQVQRLKIDISELTGLISKAVHIGDYYDAHNLTAQLNDAFALLHKLNK